MTKTQGAMPPTAPMPMELPEAWSRALILAVRPQIDAGRWPVKRAQDELMEVTADVVGDGHDLVAVELIFGPEGGEERSLRMAPLGNDVFTGAFAADELGRWRYRVRAWVDEFATWQALFRRRVESALRSGYGGEAEGELRSELLEGAALLELAAKEATGEDEEALQGHIEAFRAGEIERALEAEVLELAQRNDPRVRAVGSASLGLLVDRKLARFGAWYEFFPRSAGRPGEHGTLDDAAKQLDYVKEMGFDIVYLPPVHPIGHSYRKGKDKATSAQEGEPGSPWAIGSQEGGHKAVHPELGGLEAFDRFVARAKELGLEVALDLAYQCSPDHPYVREHPEWFRHRPDGSIRYAENPPKKYQDVYPINFESPDWQNLWLELKDVIAFWAGRGVKVFRVDNPHTKPFAFWEWCFKNLQEEYPELIFLAEAFTRPKVMFALGKVGFNQSYSYFTWRYTKHEFEEYLSELFHTEVREIYRPNFWPNTPDILPPYLNHAGRPVFEARLVMAATLSAAYGIYGPAFELMENEAHPAREEYKNNEKYEIRDWDLNDPRSLKGLIARINRIRRENPALHSNWSLSFHKTDNEQLLAYSKKDGDNLILVVVNLDPHHTQSGWLELPLHDLGLKHDEPYMLKDLLDDERYFWEGARNFVRLDPHKSPAHIFEVRKRVRREQDFDYYM
ncbi:alpha-1,4-glucan--maltose-1-phosphate maltosyltransferase [soil metagenome]